MWKCSFSSGKVITLSFKVPCLWSHDEHNVAKIKVWNYNKKMKVSFASLSRSHHRTQLRHDVSRKGPSSKFQTISRSTMSTTVHANEFVYDFEGFEYRRKGSEDFYKWKFGLGRYNR